METEMESDESKQKKLKTNSISAVRHEFNVHFVTFWHLTHLATVKSESIPIAQNWKMMSDLAKEWKKGLSFIDFSIFNGELTKMLSWMDKTTDRPKMHLEEEAIRVIENYDECLSIVKTSTQLRHDEVKAATVCEEMIELCSLNIANFKMLPLSWNYLFVSQTYQLILLARNCYQENCDEWFGQLLAKHSVFVAELREHFKSLNSSLETSSSISSTKAVNLKLSQPVVPLNTLISYFNENARCAAEQVPTALTSIVHEYCHFDPFNFDDFESIKTNVAQQAQVDK